MTPAQLEELSKELQIDAQDSANFPLLKECLAPATKFINTAHAEGRPVLVHCRVERFGCRATESFESLNDQNSVKILSEFMKCC